MNDISSPLSPVNVCSVVRLPTLWRFKGGNYLYVVKQEIRFRRG